MATISQQTPTKHADPHHKTPRTTAPNNLDAATGMVRRTNDLDNIVFLIVFILRSFLGETDISSSEEIGASITRY